MTTFHSTRRLPGEPRRHSGRVAAAWLVCFALGPVADGLAQVPSDVRKDLKSGREDVRIDAIKRAAEAGAAAVPLLLPIGAEDRDGRVRDAAFQELIRIPGDDAAARIAAELDARKPAVREFAAELLGARKASGVGEGLLARLDDKDEAVRLAATTAAGACRAEECRDRLAELAGDDEQSHVLRGAAIESFGRIGGDGVAERLREWIAEGPDGVRAVALAQLWYHDRRAVADVVAELLADDAIARQEEASPLLYQAIEEARRARRAAPIEGLVRLLEHPRPRVVSAAWRALVDLTGVEMTSDVAGWREWFDHYGDGFEVKGEGGASPPASTASKVEFLGAPIESDRVVFVIDFSGSMRDEGRDGEPKIDAARAALAEVLDALGREAMFNVIVFSDEPRAFDDGLVDATKRNARSAVTFVRGGSPKGYTNVYDALELACRQERADTVVLLSDGAPSAGRYEHYSRILFQIRRINKTRKLAFSAIALQTGEHASRFLKRLAEESGGTYVER